MLKSIQTIEKNKQGSDLYAKHSHKESMYFVIPFIDSFKDVISKLKKVDKDKWFSLVVVNNTNNFNVILKNWKNLVNLGF